jgi:phage protein U
MSAFRAVGPMISIGGALLHRVGGLNPQRLSYSSEARFPGHPVQAGMDYQKTGLGERSTTIEARTWPHVMGGLDAVEILRAIHETQAEVQMIRLQANYLAIVDSVVVIQALELDEDKLHPFDGIGRIVDVRLGLLRMPQRGANAVIRSLGGLL